MVGFLQNDRIDEHDGSDRHNINGAIHNKRCVCPSAYMPRLEMKWESHLHSKLNGFAANRINCTYEVGAFRHSWSSSFLLPFRLFATCIPLVTKRYSCKLRVHIVHRTVRTDGSVESCEPYRGASGYLCITKTLLFTLKVNKESSGHIINISTKLFPFAHAAYECGSENIK